MVRFFVCCSPILLGVFLVATAVEKGKKTNSVIFDKLCYATVTEFAHFCNCDAGVVPPNPTIEVHEKFFRTSVLVFFFEDPPPPLLVFVNTIDKDVKDLSMID